MNINKPDNVLRNIQFRNSIHTLLFSYVFISIIGLVDYYTGSEIAFSIFYLIPVLILALQKNIRYYHIILNAILASAVWYAAEIFTYEYTTGAFAIWNAFVRFIIFVLVGQLAYSLNQQQQKLKESNQRLEELNDEKNKLIGMAAHDLRNPIGNISAFSDLLITGYSDTADPNAVKIYNYIKDISSHTLEILEKLLDISVIESGTVSLSVKEQDYVNFAEKYVGLNQMIADKKHIKINFKTTKKEIILPFDENYMSEVINNLLTNAIKFSYPNSEITIQISENKNKVVTEVLDAGRGIPAGEQEKLFNYFQKTSVKPTAGERSTGLGLAIAKKIIVAHNGKIGVKSEPAKGSNFYFELPKKEN
jgi:signal transduction histidine kinase